MAPRNTVTQHSGQFWKTGGDPVVADWNSVVDIPGTLC